MVHARCVWISKVTSAQAHACPRAAQRTHTYIHTHTQTSIYHLLLFHSNNGFVNACHCYVIRTLPVLLRNIVTTSIYNFGMVYFKLNIFNSVTSLFVLASTM
jgi:hypothetical protein